MDDLYAQDQATVEEYRQALIRTDGDPMVIAQPLDAKLARVYLRNIARLGGLPNFNQANTIITQRAVLHNKDDAQELLSVIETQFNALDAKLRTAADVRSIGARLKEYGQQGPAAPELETFTRHLVERGFPFAHDHAGYYHTSGLFRMLYLEDDLSLDEWREVIEDYESFSGETFRNERIELQKRRTALICELAEIDKLLAS